MNSAPGCSGPSLKMRAALLFICLALLGTAVYASQKDGGVCMGCNVVVFTIQTAALQEEKVLMDML